LSAKSGIENELRTNFTLTKDGPFNLKIYGSLQVFRNLKLENVDGKLVYEVPITDLKKPEHVERTFPAGNYQLILRNVSLAYFFRIEISQQSNDWIQIAFINIFICSCFFTSSR
jgi:hypothetical protein